MCVIAYLPANVKADKESFRNCFDFNPDGAGFMWQDRKHNLVKIKKGFMQFEPFWNELNSLPVNVDRVVHCRIATSGKVDRGCCHPFPVTKDIKEMKKTDHITRIGVAHNGIISWATPKAGMQSFYSDTMAFTSEYLSKSKDIIFNKEYGKMIQKATNSKFVILGGKDVSVIGDFIEDNGVLYSNDSYKSFEYGNYGAYGCYGYGEEGGYYGDYQHGPYTIYFAIDASYEMAELLAEELEKDKIFVGDYNVLLNGIEIEVDSLPIRPSYFGTKWVETVI